MTQYLSKSSIYSVLSIFTSAVLGILTLLMFLPSTMVNPFYLTGLCFFGAFIISLDTFRSTVNQYTPLAFTRITTTLTIIGFMALGFGLVPA